MSNSFLSFTYTVIVTALASLVVIIVSKLYRCLASTFAQVARHFNLKIDVNSQGVHVDSDITLFRTKFSFGAHTVLGK